MKKYLVFVITTFVLLTFSGSAFAANAVSQMATTAGGQMVAQCAQSMNNCIPTCVANN